MVSDVRVVCDRDAVAAGDDVMANGWSVMVPDSMPISVVIREHVVPHLASMSGPAEWLVTLADDMTYRVSSEAVGFYPTTYYLTGDRRRITSMPVAKILREPSDSDGSQTLVAMDMLIPDTAVGQVTLNPEGDVAFYVKCGPGLGS